MGKTRILPVEDQVADARLTREVLVEHRAEEFDITHVTNLQDASGRLASQDLDLLLLDLSLPNAHGLDALIEAHRVRGGCGQDTDSSVGCSPRDW